IDPRLDRVVARLLQPEPRDRFQRAAKLLDALAPLGVTPPRAAAADEPGALELAGDVLTARAGRGGLAKMVEEVRTALVQTQRRLALGWDLCAVRGLDVLENQKLIELHRVHAARLSRVGFSAQVPVVRGSAVVIGRSAEPVPWRVFPEPTLMRAWLAEVAR
ncbi:MAG: hypothetical protein ACK4N5_26395, partial [Myxococcales bacterium]